MALDELDRLSQQIEALRKEVHRLQDQQVKSRSKPQEPSSFTERENNLHDYGGAVEDLGAQEEKPSWQERAEAFPRKHPYYSLAILFLAGGLAVGGYRLWNYLNSYESTSDARISGFISPISSQVAGTVIKVFVQNDQFVKAGQPLVTLDPRNYQLLVERARAIVDQTKAEVEAARRNYDTALTKLHEAQTSNAKAQILKAAQDAADAAHSIVAAKTAAEHAAQAGLDQALLKLHSTNISAPVTGIVAERSVNIGQQVQPSQRLLAIVQTGDLWVTANFKETQLKRIHPREPVTIHVDALGRDYQGYVQSIAPATRAEFSLLPSENATGNYVKVVQRIAVQIRLRSGQEHERLKPGMSVEPTIWVNGR